MQFSCGAARLVDYGGSQSSAALLARSNHPMLSARPSRSPPQSDLIAGKYMKAPPEAALADKAASKARKAARRSTASGNTGGGAQDFRRYSSPSGFAVLVGRNSRQNDTLTMDMANPGDVWMHARCGWVCGRLGGCGEPRRSRWDCSGGALMLVPTTGSAFAW